MASIGHVILMGVPAMFSLWEPSQRHAYAVGHCGAVGIARARLWGGPWRCRDCTTRGTLMGRTMAVP